MFTGLVEATGTVQKINNLQGDLVVCINKGCLDFSDVALGDSIAVNGVCLTVVELSANSFMVDVSAETLKCTTFDQLTVGKRVNLEKALRLSDRLGGHLVSGHVDGIGEIVEKRSVARSIFFKIKVPSELVHYITNKGAITIDGASLTVNMVNQVYVELNIIPQTIKETVINDYQVGTPVNIEVDLLARYLERLLLGRMVEKESHLTPEFLAVHGFIR